MTSRLDNEHVDELLGLYALDVADESERAAVEAHLPACARCRALLDGYQESVHRLPNMLPLMSPPLRVRAGLLRALPHRGRLNASRLWVAGGVGVAASLVVGVALGVGIVALQLGDQVKETRAETAKLEEMMRQERVVSYWAASPDTEVLVLKATTEGDRSYAMLMGPSSGRFAVLVAGGMKKLGPGRAYQLWLTTDGQRASGGTFMVDESGWAQLQLRPQAPVEELHGVGITEEPEGGSPRPTTEPVLVWARP